MTAPRRPIVFDASQLPPASEPDQDPFALPPGQAMERVATLAVRPAGGWFRRLVWWAAGVLASLIVAVMIYDSLRVLAVSYPLLGTIAAGLAAVVGLGLFAVILREIAGIARLRRIDSLRRRIDAAARSDQRASALAATTALATFYDGRAELIWARQDFAARLPDCLDPGAILSTAEHLLMAPLDAAARLEIELSARQVAAATAIVPLPILDVLAALTINLRMLRQIAQIYGGRTGTLGSWRLLRAVGAHLLATGAVAVGDDLLGSVVGGGAIGKVSRRLGEGVVNGALTARVGIAALEVCRPMPFAVLKRPRVTSLVKRALSGLFS